jgi:hypothetical protein
MPREPMIMSLSACLTELGSAALRFSARVWRGPVAEGAVEGVGSARSLAGIDGLGR